MRLAALVALLFLIAGVPAWRRPGLPQPPPQGFGVALGYGLGAQRELDALGKVWYLDYNHTGGILGDHPRLLVVQTQDDLESVSSVAQANRGAWWQFGNEPNDPAQDNISASEYARYYQRFYLTLKRIDPSARITSAGIANADWQWADAFRQAYRSQFGRYPPIDGWNIHNYLLNDCTDALDVEAFRSRILLFRAWMSRIGEENKPLFLSEYGVLYGNGCCGCPSIPAQGVIRYMQETSNWLSVSHTVTAWAWFAVNTGNRFNGDLFEDGSNITLFGQAYQDLVKHASTPSTGGK